jgi:hypothetical protein
MWEMRWQDDRHYQRSSDENTVPVQVPRGWPLVNAICDYVHDRIIFGYANASPTKRILAITLCRCMNIPARWLHRLSQRDRRAARQYSDGFQR